MPWQTRDPPFQPLLSIADLSNVKTIVKNEVQRVEFIYLRPAISDFANCGPHLDRQDKEAGRERGDMLLVAYLPSNFPEISHYTAKVLKINYEGTTKPKITFIGLFVTLKPKKLR